VEVGLVVVVLGAVLDGVAGEFGVVVDVVPLELAPGVIVVPVALLPVVPVVSGFDDCGTPVELAGTQSAVAVVEVPGVELEVELGEVELVELLLGEALLVEEVEPVLLVELGDVLELLGEVLLVEELGVDVVLLVEPVALALVRGTIPAGQLLVEDAPLGVVDGVVLCEEGVVALVPVCDEVEGEVVVLVVVDVVCAATHVAPAVRITSNVSFFMFSVLVNRVALDCDAQIQGRVRRPTPKRWAGVHRPSWVEVAFCFVTYGPCAAATRPSPSSPSQAG
jgi:hypothetical protein